MVGLDPVHLPDQVLESRNYIWDVIPWTKGAWSHTLGPTTLTIPENAPELPWPDIDDLLAGVPREHARLLYPRADLSAILIPLHHTKTLLESVPARCRPGPNLLQNTGRTTEYLEYGEYFSYIRGYIDRKLMDLSLAFLMTEANRYADAAKRILLEIVSWPTDDDDVTSVSARWGDGPRLSSSKCAHFAYDWFYDALNGGEKQIVFKRCEDQARQPYRYLTA